VVDLKTEATTPEEVGRYMGGLHEASSTGRNAS
jgi:hypothetical protein